MSKAKRKKEFLKLYGKEWEVISRKAKALVNHTCEKCGATHSAYYLDSHHIIPISHFLETGYKIRGSLHKCYGVLTSKPWHVESNIMVLCMKCHAKEHPHLQKLYKKGKRKWQA